MEQSMSSFTGTVALLVAGAIWAILFVAVLGALKKASLLPGWARYVLVTCASLLSVIGMSRIFSGGPGRSLVADRESPLEFLLLPYAAMGIAMLLVLLLLFLRKFVSGQADTGRRAEGIFEETSGHHKKPGSVNAISPAARQEAGSELRAPGALVRRRCRRRS